MLDLAVIYDDRMRPPEEAQSFIGIGRFGDLLYRKRLLCDHIRSIMREAGAIRFVAVRDDAEFSSALRSIAEGPTGTKVIYFPSFFAPTDPSAMRRFFSKLRYSEDSFKLLPTSTCNGPVLAIKAEYAPTLLRRVNGSEWRTAIEESEVVLHVVDNQPSLVDLAEPGVLAAYLSSTFDVRHFNSISLDPLTVTKRSGDIAKMRREYRYFSLLPEALRLFFLPALGWEEGQDWASYRTERLYMPDLAIQWVHRAFDERTFSTCLSRIIGYLKLRNVREVDKEGVEREYHLLYIDKVNERHRQLAESPLGRSIDAMLAVGSRYHSLGSLIDRYQRLCIHLKPKRRRLRQAISHGDLCFSNILYGRQQRMMKFIDPRGADNEEGLWLDEYYDLAKLSHSALGSYDFINHDLFDICHGRDLGLELRIENDGMEGLRECFKTHVTELGYDMNLVRLYEASLFLSMLPLHAEGPKKVLAFVLIAGGILDELEQVSS